VLSRRATPPIRFSHDGRWVAFGSAAVVASEGGPTLHPLRGVRNAARAWAWAPRRAAIAAATAGGGIVFGGPHLRPRRIVAEGWGAQDAAFAPDGAITASRVIYSKTAKPVHAEIWTFAGPRFTPNEIVGGASALGGAQPWFASWSPGSSWVFFWLYPNSSSLAADGMSLQVKGAALGALGPRIATTLGYSDYLSWCGSRLVAAAGGDRYATHGKHLVVASPPGPAEGQGWRMRELSRDRSRSWVSPACSPNGSWVAAAAGRNWVETRFGQERRSIWLLRSAGRARRRLTAPPPGATDESPRWLGNRNLLFVRTRGARGRLYGVDGRSGRLSGPLAQLGPVDNYYGHYGWSDELAVTPAG
jgi:hypothetical protein